MQPAVKSNGRQWREKGSLVPRLGLVWSRRRWITRDK